MLGRYLRRTLEGWDHFFFFPFVGKNGFYPRLRCLWALRAAAEMLMSDSSAEDVDLIKEAGRSRGI